MRVCAMFYVTLSIVENELVFKMNQHFFYVIVVMPLYRSLYFLFSSLLFLQNVKGRSALFIASVRINPREHTLEVFFYYIFLLTKECQIISLGLLVCCSCWRVLYPCSRMKSFSNLYYLSHNTLLYTIIDVFYISIEFWFIQSQSLV